MMVSKFGISSSRGPFSGVYIPETGYCPNKILNITEHHMYNPKNVQHDNDKLKKPKNMVTPNNIML